MATIAFLPAISKLPGPCVPSRPIIAAAAPARSISSSTTKPPSDAAAVAGEHWTAKYRRRLGIGDSPVVLVNPYIPWQLPKQGEFKLSYSISMPEVDKDSGRYVDNIGGFGITARGSSGDLFGLANGRIVFRSRLGMQLYALRAAGNLVRLLKDEGIHDGPVVYDSEQILVTHCLGLGCDGEAEALLKDFMPDDLEKVDKRCRMCVGDPEAIYEDQELAGWYPNLRAEMEKEKRNAGLL